MITVKRKVTVKLGNRGCKKIEPAGETAKPKPRGKIPRVARLMALAIQFEEMLRNGEAIDATDLAVRYSVSQPRMSQIRALTLLAPDIQEAVLNLPAVITGRSLINEKCLRPIRGEVDFDRQREMWKAVSGSHVEQAKQPDFPAASTVESALWGSPSAPPRQQIS